MKAPNASFRMTGMRTGSRKSSLFLNSLTASSYGSNYQDGDELFNGLLKIARLVPVTVINKHLNEVSDNGIVPQVESFEAAVLFADISGFSSLAEKLVAKSGSSVNAAEELSLHIGKSLDLMVRTVAKFGGDVIKFAGDAILVVFNSTLFNESLERATLCAIFVAMEILSLELTAGDVELSVHCGIGAGLVFGSHVGGLHNRWEYIITGQPIAQIGSAEPEAKAGEIVLSREAHQLTGDSLEGTVLPSSNFLFKSFVDKSNQNFKHRKFVFSTLRNISNQSEVRRLVTLLSSYIPRPSVLAIECGKGDWIAELRQCSIVFCRIVGLSFNTLLDLQYTQDAIFLIQRFAYKYEGTLCRFIFDDKGAGILFAFGLPPYMHENDAVRATKASLEISEQIKSLKGGQVEVGNLVASIGVTTGKVFCGTVGGKTRCEYTLHGTVVNLAARFMVAANTGVLCCAETYLNSKSYVSFKEPVDIQVKGKESSVKVYRPVSFKSDTLNLQEALLSLKSLPGRENQEQQMKRVMRQIVNRNNNRSVIVVEGEAGSGKSSFAKRAHKTALELHTVSFIQTKAVDTEKTKPYYLWKSVISQLVVAHYTKSLGLYFYIEDTQPRKAGYSGVPENEMKFSKSFYERVLELGLPSFEALPKDMRLEVLKDMISILPKHFRVQYYQLNVLLPNFFEDSEQLSHDKKFIDFSFIVSMLNAVFSEIRTKRSVKRKDGFRTSIPSLLGSDFAEKDNPEFARRENPNSKFEFNTTGIDKKSSPVSSVFAFTRKKKKIHSTSYVSLAQDMPLLEKSNSSKSEPAQNLLFSRNDLGGSKEIFKSCFLRLAKCTNLLLCFEDIDYADTLSWKVLLAVYEAQDHCLMLLTKRPSVTLSNSASEVLNKLTEEKTLRISLPNLLFEELRAAILSWLKVKQVSDNIVSLIFNKSNGHPFFSQELVNLMKEKDMLNISEDLCTLKNVIEATSIQLPNNVSTLIIAKLDKLPRNKLDLLKSLSVLGVGFTKQEALDFVVEDTLNLNITATISFYQDLKSLACKGFLIETENSYCFSSSLLQETSYGMLLFKERQDLHLRLAHRLEIKHLAYLDLVLGKLAYHYFKADEYKTAQIEKRKSKAVRYILKYGLDCLQQQDFEEAYKFFCYVVSIENYSLEYTEGVETEVSLIRRCLWRIDAANAALKCRLFRECNKLIYEVLSLLGLPKLSKPSKILSRRFSRGHFTYKRAISKLVSTEHFSRVFLAGQCLSLYVKQIEPKATNKALLYYEVNEETCCAALEQQLMSNNCDKSRRIEIYNFLALFYANYSLFITRYNGMNLLKSKLLSQKALDLKDFCDNQTHILEIMLTLTKRSILAGELDLASQYVEKSCWTAKFTKSVTGVVDAYVASIEISLLQGKIVQAFHSNLGAQAASSHDIFLKIHGLLSVVCNEQLDMKKTLNRLCHTPITKFKDENVFQMIYSRNCAYTNYIFAAILIREYELVSPAIELLKRAVQILCNQDGFSFILTQQVLFFLCLLFDEVSELTKNSPMLVSRRKSTNQVTPFKRFSALNLFSRQDIFKEINQVYNKLNRLSRKYTIFEAIARFIHALTRSLNGSNKREINIKFAQTILISRSIPNPYICALAYKKLYYLNKESNNKDAELYKNEFHDNINRTLIFKAEHNITSLPGLKPYEP